ncbi:transposase IS903 [Vibrio cholerae]|nr:hypothetical protein [Vibrio cholerae]GIB61455.1 transposase IS903 [Vibrio cholerae]
MVFYNEERNHQGLNNLTPDEAYFGRHDTQHELGQSLKKLVYMSNHRGPLLLSNVTDAEVLPNLLKQPRRKIAEISGGGADDTKGCYEAIRIKRAVALIPPRDGAAFWERGHVACQLYGANKHWKPRYGYHKRSLRNGDVSGEAVARWKI